MGKGGNFFAFDIIQASRLARLRLTADGGFLRPRIPEPGRGDLVSLYVSVAASAPPSNSRTSFTNSPLALLCWYNSSIARGVEGDEVAMVTWRVLRVPGRSAMTCHCARGVVRERGGSKRGGREGWQV